MPNLRPQLHKGVEGLFLLQKIKSKLKLKQNQNEREESG
jgi:hypothetical protein